MEQKVIVLMASAMDEGGVQANLQKQIDDVMAKHRGWKVTSATTAMACETNSDAYGNVHSYLGFVTTLVLEKNYGRDQIP